jgi:hypothetical protein
MFLAKIDKIIKIKKKLVINHIFLPDIGKNQSYLQELFFLFLIAASKGT